MYGEKIKTIRELRGFTQEYLAGQLEIEQNTYSKIETGHTKLKADTLKKIAEILGVSPTDILSSQPTIINFEQNHGTQGLFIKHLYTFHRELVDKMVASKESEIQLLKEVNAGLLKEKEQLFQLLKSQLIHSSY